MMFPLPLPRSVFQLPVATAGCIALLMMLWIGAAPAMAQTGPELLLKPFPKELRLDAMGSLYFQEGGHARQSDADLRISEYETEGRLRLFPGELASPRLGYQFQYLDIDSTVPGLPDHVIDHSVGVATPLAKFDDWIVGLSLGVGYAGESLYGDGDAWYGLASLLFFKELSETESIGFGVVYDGNRTFRPDLPLPGFAYIRRIRSDLLLTVGLPVTSIEWRPQENIRIELSYLLVDDIRARIGYEVAKGLELYGSVAQRSDAYFLDGQIHNDDRLLFQQRRAEIGLNWRTRDAGVGDQDLELTAAIGYAWDGEFSVGFDQSDSRLLTDVSDEPYFRLALQARF